MKRRPKTKPSTGKTLACKNDLDKDHEMGNEPSSQLDLLRLTFWVQEIDKNSNLGNFSRLIDNIRFTMQSKIFHKTIQK